jgi:uncharacterized protein (DUF169 family)
MTTSREINDTLNLYIRPTTFPVGVLPLREVAEAPTELLLKAKEPVRDLGHPVTLCMAVGLARRYGWAILVRRQDNACPLGGVAMGFEPPGEAFLDGTLFAEYTGRPKEAVQRDARETPRFAHGAYEAMLVTPLHTGVFDPDVTIVYGNSAQVMRLVQAALWNEGGQVRSQASGSLDCADLIVQTLQADECRFVLPCNGDRVFGMAQDNEMAFAMPRSKAPAVLEGLGGTHRMGQRYPIPTFMRFRPEMPPAYQKMLEQLRGNGAGSSEGRTAR